MRRGAPGSPARRRVPRRARIDVVVKIGGALLAHATAFDAVLATLGAAPAAMLVVPGGGPFADAVRAVDRQRPLAVTTAHWMAVLAMDQYAWLLAGVIPRGCLVRSAADAVRACDAHRVPVLAPWTWLHAADPLPHSWDVTSDSIAAWVAGAVGASRLVLVKPPRARGELVDAAFERTLPPGVVARIVPAEALDELAQALDAPPAAATRGLQPRGPAAGVGRS